MAVEKSVGGRVLFKRGAYVRPYVDAGLKLKETWLGPDTDHVIAGFLPLYAEGRLYVGQGAAWLGQRLVFLTETLEFDVSALNAPVLYAGVSFVPDPNAVCGEAALFWVGDAVPEGGRVLFELWQTGSSEGVSYEPVPVLPVVFTAQRGVRVFWFRPGVKTQRLYVGFCPDVFAVFAGGKPVGFSFEPPYALLSEPVGAGEDVVVLTTRGCSGGVLSGGLNLGGAVSSIKLTKA